MKKVLLALVIGCSMSSAGCSTIFPVTTVTNNTAPKYTTYNTSKNTKHNISDIQSLVTQTAERHKVPGNLAHAIVKLESSYNPTVTGQLGEIGLGQIRCSTAKQLGFKGQCNELYKPEVNLEYTMLYLRYALDLTNDDMCKAASFYGSGSVPKSNSTKYCRVMLSHLN